MPLSFLAPVFLAGLAALAVPVLIHLSSRPKKEVVRFPSLMFLDRVEYRDASRRRLRDVLLFALRALALILLAAAFARPYIDRPDAPAVAVEGGREIVVLLDRSASMGVGDRMTRGRDAVMAVADGLRRGDRATLVVFDRDAAAANRATDQPAVLRAAADTVLPGDGSTRFAPPLRLAESILEGSPLPNREVILISDFPAAAWDPGAGIALPPRTAVRAVDVADGGDGPAADGAGGIAVVDVSFARERFDGRERVRTTARLVNHGARDTDVAVTLALDGRDQGTRRVAVPAAGGAVATFDAVTLPDRPVRGTVRTQGDEVAFDDVFHFTLAAARGPRVRLVRAGAGPRPPYLARALEAGGGHDLAALDASSLTAALASADVVILEDADPPSDDAARRLRAWVEAGGGLVIVVGERLQGRRLDGLLPGRLDRTTDRGIAGGVITRVEPQHPAFATFRSGAAGAGDGRDGGPALTGSRFFRYRHLQPDPRSSILARFDDGAPAIIAAEAGRGRVVALTTPVDGQWSDLVLQPSFVPLVHGVVRHAAGTGPAPAWRTVGELLDVAPLLAGEPGDGARDGRAQTAGRAGAAGEEAAANGDRPVLLTPGGARLPIADGSTLIRLEERGFYEVRDPRGGGAAPVVAVNVDPGESDPRRVDPGEVRSALQPRDGAAPLVSGAPADRERRQSLWWWALAAAFALMVAETLLGNTLSRRPRPPVAGGDAR